MKFLHDISTEISKNDRDIIQKNVDKTMKKVKEGLANGEITENIEGVGEKFTELGYKGEEFFEIFKSKYDNLKGYVKKQSEDYSKYDFTVEEDGRTKYVDLKTYKTNTAIRDIKDRKYPGYFQKKQIDGAKRFCDENEIAYENYYFNILYWNGYFNVPENNYNNYCGIVSCDELRLDNILKNTEPVFTQIPGTDPSIPKARYHIVRNIYK